MLSKPLSIFNKSFAQTKYGKQWISLFSVDNGSLTGTMKTIVLGVSFAQNDLLQMLSVLLSICPFSRIPSKSSKMKDEYEDTNMKYHIKKQIPEGGWGHLVCIGLALQCGLTLGMMSSVGMVFSPDFLKSIGAQPSALSTVLGLLFVTTSVSCLLAGVLFRKYHMRTIGLIGAVCWFLGSLMNAFGTSVFMLVISSSIFQGWGLGFMLPVSYATFNHYFVQKRFFMMGVAQALKSFLVMLHPIIVNFLLTQFGQRMGVFILSAIDATAILAMLVMHPVEWHYKLIKVPTNSLNSAVPLMNDEQEKLSIKSELKINEVVEEYRPKCTEFWYTVADFLDLKLLKDIIYVNIVLGTTFELFSDMLFTTLMPVYLNERGITMSDAAMFASILAGADLVSRIAFAFVSYFISIGPRYISFFASVCAIIFRSVFVNIFEYNGLKLIIFGLGFMRGLAILTIPLMLADHLSKERFASGYALYNCIQGIIHCMLSPLIGQIREITHSYALCIHALSVITSLCVIPWAIEFIWTQFRSKKTKNIRSNDDEKLN